VNFKTLAVLPVVGLIAACNPSTPEITDEQLIDLLGKSDRATGLRTIPTNIVECTGLISGADADLLKDAPNELVGMIKTGCREELNRALQNKERNPEAFKLSVFEDTKIANRIKTLADQKDTEIAKKREAIRIKENAEREAAEREREKERLRIKAETDAKNIEAMNQAKSEAKRIAEYTSNWLDTYRDRCDYLESLPKKIRGAGESVSPMLFNSIGKVCFRIEFRNIEKDMESYLEKVEKLKYDPEEQDEIYIPTPYYTINGSLLPKGEEIDNMIEEMENRLESSLN